MNTLHRKNSFFAKTPTLRFKNKSRDLGDQARGKRDWPLAIRYYREYLSHNPRDFAIWVQLGHAYKESGQRIDALRAYSEGLNIRNDDPDLLLQIGHLHKLMGHTDKALSFYERSYQQDGNAYARDEMQSLRPDVSIPAHGQNGKAPLLADLKPTEIAAVARPISGYTAEHIAEIEAKVARALAARDTAERQRQRAVQRIEQLRRAVDIAGTEARLAQDMAHSLERRYKKAVAARSDTEDTGVPPPPADGDWLARDIADLNACIYFDADWYLDRYPDVREEGIDPAHHYLTKGAAAFYDPGPWFSSRHYLTQYPDIAAGGANPLLHYIRHGQKEGRSARSVPTVPQDRSPAAEGHLKFSCLFVTGEPESAGHYYRVLRYMDAAAAIDVHTACVRADDLHGRLDELASYHIAIFWRVAWTEEVGAAIARLREAGRKVIFDVDDLMTEPSMAQIKTIDGIRTQSLTEDGVRAHYDRVRRTMLESDACFTTTEELAFYLRRAGKVTYVLPNGFDRGSHDLARLEVRKRRATGSDGLVRIGYAGGSRTHQRDFAVAAAGVAQVLKDNSQCRLVLFRSVDGPLVDVTEFPALKALERQIEWRDAQPLADLPRELARFDINIAPLEVGNPYCEAKSELKFFEAALVDVPTVASPTGPFRRAIQHGKTGFLAASADDWQYYLHRLVSDQTLRDNLGRSAYRYSLAEFGPDARALRFTDVIEQLKGGVSAARGFALGAQRIRREPKDPTVLKSNIVFERDKLGCADVTVVIPLYNYDNYILETLESVRTQTAPLLDLVIVDGFSTDDSLSVASRWAEKNADRFNRIIVMQNCENYGLGFCRNSGFDTAETPYVFLLDADNKLLPEACTELADVLKKTGAAFAHSIIARFGASTVPMGTEPFEPQRLAAGNYIDAMALVSKEAWGLIGGFNHVRYGWEDYDFWCRLAEIGLRGEWVEKVLCQYRSHAASMQNVQTSVPQNYRDMVDNFKDRHPWTSLLDLESRREAPAIHLELTTKSKRTRLDTLLPILRCPKSKQKLGYDARRTALRSFDGLHSWPIQAGVPLLRPNPADTETRITKHVSNFLPAAAHELIQASEGWVLNLSAGGTNKRFGNVIELEYAIFRHTDVAADAHDLPFDDGVFEAVIVINAFEHYRDPPRVASEIHRVLKPGGKVLIATAFLQPLHEKPWHFYNCTRYGLEEWLKEFMIDEVKVTPNFSPNFSLGWIASEVEQSLRTDLAAETADAFMAETLGDVVGAFRDPTARGGRTWHDVARLPQTSQENTAAGFQVIGRKADVLQGPMKTPSPDA